MRKLTVHLEKRTDWRTNSQSTEKIVNQYVTFSVFFGAAVWLRIGLASWFGI